MRNDTSGHFLAVERSGGELKNPKDGVSDTIQTLGITGKFWSVCPCPAIQPSSQKFKRFVKKQYTRQNRSKLKLSVPSHTHPNYLPQTKPEEHLRQK